MADNGWQRKFEDPIPLPDGRELVTLRGAANDITSLPKKETDLPEWQAAIEALLLVSRSGPTMLARIGVMKASNRHVERVFNPDRKETHGANGSSRGTNDRLCLRQHQQAGWRSPARQGLRHKDAAEK